MIGNVPPGAGGVFRPDQKEMGLQPISAEISPNQQVKTLIHELAHALVRCDRREDDPDLGYAEEEVVVERVAFTVCSGLGFGAAGLSVPYVASWSAGGEIERHAALIDRLARRLEEVTLPGPEVDAGSAEPEEPADVAHQPGPLEDTEVVTNNRGRLAPNCRSTSRVESSVPVRRPRISRRVGCASARLCSSFDLFSST